MPVQARALTLQAPAPLRSVPTCTTAGAARAAASASECGPRDRGPLLCPACPGTNAASGARSHSPVTVACQASVPRCEAEMRSQKDYGECLRVTYELLGEII